VKLSLVKFSLLSPTILTYCIDALNLSTASIKDLDVCWNDCFRRLLICLTAENTCPGVQCSKPVQVCYTAHLYRCAVVYTCTGVYNAVSLCVCVCVPGYTGASAAPRPAHHLSATAQSPSRGVDNARDSFRTDAHGRPVKKVIHEVIV